MTTLKAYEVHDGDDGWCVTFATNSATARRKGANELNCDWEGVEHCRRRPEFDRYAPGPVPAAAKIEAGWWYECFHCGRRVSNELHDDIEGEGLDPADFSIVTHGSRVYCSHTCRAVEQAQTRGRTAAETALIELVETKFPGSTVAHVNVYGHRLTAEKDHCVAYFTFPGGQHQATYKFGEGDTAWVSQCDADAFRALYRKDQPSQGAA